MSTVDPIDEPPADLPPADVDALRGPPPAYLPPKPPVMGPVTDLDTAQPMGMIDPKVVLPSGLSAQPSAIEELKAHFAAQLDDLHAQVAEIETLLGFVTNAGDLSVRVAAIERFVGIK